MDYNKFIYKINKYKSYQRDPNKKRKEHYQKKIDFYYRKINEILDNIKNKKGGTLTDADLVNFLEPTTKSLEEHLDKKANIVDFQNLQKKYEENHIKILEFLDKLLEANTDLNRLNDEGDEKIKEITEQLKTMDEKHKKDIQDKLKQIQIKIKEQQKLTLKDIEDKYKLKLKL
jgi:hypothetical protein